jgi:catechol 2,3-dioxygenase-like lactoylglutathione lyase family enzyme
MAAAVCACCGESFEQGWVTLWCHQDIVICYTCLDYLNGQRARQIAIAGGVQPPEGFDPVFRVRDLARAIGHYERLGFSTSRHDDDYAFATWSDLVIHLAQDENPAPSTLYIHVADADEVARRWREAGLEVDGPQNQDYGKREGHHTDPDGNLLRFGGPPR